MVESISSTPSEQADLPHAASEKFAEPARPGDEVLGSDNTGPHRGTYRTRWVVLPLGYSPYLPSPLLKHRLTLSNGSQSSFMGVPDSAATCHSLAPSRCVFIPSFRANSDILIISS